MTSRHLVSQKQDPADGGTLARAMPAFAVATRDKALDSITDILDVTRRYLGMEVAFVAEFVGETKHFRYVEAPFGEAIAVGRSLRAQDGYCRHIVDGVIPELITDTAAVPAVSALAVTATLPIGSHIGVPIRLRDRRIYGTFCCLSANPDPSLGDRDVQMMHAFADLVANQIDRALDDERIKAESFSRIEAVIAGGERSIAFQPIHAFTEGRIIGVEALSRFAGMPVRGPDSWFAEAGVVGLLPDLECAAIASAMAALPRLPAGVYLAVNVSPPTIFSAGFRSLFAAVPVGRIVLEITEHADVPDYTALATELAPLRQRGLRVAVDDAGAGYASLQHILNLKPDIIKLDMSLTRNVDTDPARRSLAAALVHFAADIGCQLVAEGIETDAELETLRAFGVSMAQGYRLGRPMALDDLLASVAPA